MAVKRVIVISAETKAAQKSVDELTEQLEIQDKVIKKLTRDQEFYEDKLASTNKANLAAVTFYNNKLKETQNELRNETRSRKTLTDEQKKANKTLAETTKKQNKLSGVMGSLDKITGGAISSMTAFYTSIMTAVKGMNLLKIAWIATGIGAFVILITSLVASFKRSEEGQEKLQVGLAMLGAVVDQVMDLFASLGTAIFDAITNPKQALIDFKDAFVENITNRISSAIETIGFLGTAIKKVFDGDFSGAMKDAKKAGSSYIDTMTGVKNTIDKVSDSVSGFVKETLSEVSAIAEITKARQKAHHIDRALKVERAKADREINDIRLKAEDREKFNATERVALLKEAQSLEEAITQKEIISQRIKIKAQEDEMALGKSTIEDKDKLAEMQAKLIELDTKKLRSQRLLQTQITTAANQEKAEKQRLIDEGIAEQEAADKLETERLNKIEADRKLTNDKEIADAKAVADAKKAIRNAELDNIANGVNILAKLAPKSKALQAAGIIASNAVGIAKIIQNTTAANAAARLKYALFPVGGQALATAEIAANKVSAGINIATSVAATAKGLSTLNAGGSASSSVSLPNDSAGGVQAPSFNIVGQGAESQIASALGDQQQTPIQAFVVSQDVTTAQSLENGIISGATLGG